MRVDLVLPLVGVVIGGALTIAGNYLLNWMDRRDRTERRRAEFQRDTLLRLQQVMFDFGRRASEIHLQDIRGIRDGGEYGRDPASNRVSEDFRLSTVEVHMLAVRVDDEELRRLTQVFTSAVIDVTAAKSDVDARNLLEFSVELHQQANERIGVLLRQYA